MRSNETMQGMWNVPKFYSGMIAVNPSLENNETVQLTASVAQIDIDASSDEFIQIDSVEMKGAASTTLLFEGMKQDSSANKQIYLHVFKPSASGLLSNIFKSYKCNSRSQELLSTTSWVVNRRC